MIQNWEQYCRDLNFTDFRIASFVNRVGSASTSTTMCTSVTASPTMSTRLPQTAHVGASSARHVFVSEVQSVLALTVKENDFG